MSDLPPRLSPGQRLTAHWLNRLLDYLRSRDLRPGPGARLTRTPAGTTIGVAVPPAAASVTESEPLPALFSVRVFEDGRTGIYLPFGNGVYEEDVVRVNGLDVPPIGIPTENIDAALAPGWKNANLRGLIRVRVTLPSETSTGGWSIVASGALKSDEGEGTSQVDVPIAFVPSQGRTVSQIHVGCIFLTHLEYTDCGDDSEGSSSSSSPTSE